MMQSMRSNWLDFHLAILRSTHDASVKVRFYFTSLVLYEFCKKAKKEL